MRTLSAVFFLGIIRDRVLYGILVLAGLFILIPTTSSLSIRQAGELSITLSFSIISFLLMFLAVVFSSFSVWRDIERRYTSGLLALPVSRVNYILAKFVANIAIIALCSLLFAGLTYLTVSYTCSLYPPATPLVWSNIFLAIFYNMLKYTLLAAFGILFSTVSTSFFLPIFGTVALFFCGSMSQDVYNYLSRSAATDVPLFIQKLAAVFYYIIPNFSAFDFKLAAIYSLPINSNDLWLTAGYFVLYTAIVLFLACFFFNRRELR
jgi:ABC-type transport system involved in multi-copper enzyme maturation permease subunit